MSYLRVTEADLDEHFEGIMIWVRDWPSGEHRVPGWKCLHCGWMVGSIELPRGHECPEEGQAQRERAALDGDGA